MLYFRAARPSLALSPQFHYSAVLVRKDNTHQVPNPILCRIPDFFTQGRIP